MCFPNACYRHSPRRCKVQGVPTGANFQEGPTYVKAKKAEEGYGGNEPAKFVMKERYYVLENGILTKLKKKEVKKLGLLKILSK